MIVVAGVLKKMKNLKKKTVRERRKTKQAPLSLSHISLTHISLPPTLPTRPSFFQNREKKVLSNDLFGRY